MAVLGTSRWSYLIIVLLGFLTFSNSLGNYLLMDDFWHLNKIASIDWTEWWKPWSFSGADNQSYWMAMHRVREIQESSFFFRPAVTTLFGLIESVGGGQVWTFHFANILLHAMTSLVFLGIARRFVGRNLASFGAAVIFAVHPAHCESVQWVAANADLLVGLFYSMAFYSHMRARQGEGAGWWWSAAAAVCFLLALSSKEMAITFPGIALLYDALFFRPGLKTSENQTRISLLNPSPFWRTPRFYGLMALYAAIAVFYLYQHYRVISGVAELNQGGNYIADWRQPGFLSTVFVNLAVYLWHFWTFFPLMPLDTREAWQDAWWVILLVWGGLIVFYRWLGGKTKNSKEYRFFWAWQILTVLPALPVLMSQRVLYIPSIGFCLLVGLILREHWLGCMEDRRRGWWLFPAAVVACLLVTMGMNTMWEKPSRLIREQIRQIAGVLPAPKPGSRIYLVDIWQPSYGIEEGLRRHYRDRSLDVQVLSFSPKILDVSEPTWGDPLEKLFSAFFPEACGPLTAEHRLGRAADGRRHLHLKLHNDVYFQGLVEGIIPVEPRLGEELSSIDNSLFSVVLARNPDGAVDGMDFYFAEDGVTSYFLAFENGRYALISQDESPKPADGGL